MTLPISALIQKHIGRPAVVIGGGMSAPEQLRKCPADAILISTNQHGEVLARCDYIVCIDDILNRDLPIAGGNTARIRQFGTPIVSTRRWADYRIFEQPAHNSAIVACWAAWIMGCAPIIPIGIDLYKGGVYFHTVKAKSSGPSQLTEHQLARWRGFKEKYPDPMVRPIGGPLLKVFPAYDPVDTWVPVEHPLKLRRVCEGNTVKLVKPLKVHGFEVSAGVHELSAAELRHAHKQKAVA